MKHISCDYKDQKAYKKAQIQAQKKKYKSQLIQIYTGLTSKKKIQTILNKVVEDFPKAIVIGTTTAGEISRAKMYDNSTIISLSLFETTELKYHYVKTTNKKSAIELFQNITSKETKANIILSEGLHGKDYEGFIQAINQQSQKIITSGGLAGDNFHLKKTYIFLNKKIYDTGSIGLSFSGKKLFATNEYNLNWTPIGKEFTITSAEQNIIHKIEEMSAVDFFKHYLGTAIFQNDAEELADIQLLYTEGNTTVSRTPMAIDNNSIVMAGPLKEGQKVQFGFSNAASVISGSNKIGANLAKKPAEAIYIFSCIARKTLLGKVLENEFKSFESVAPTAGFFTYGEFFSTDTKNALLNCTTTILVLSENSSKESKKGLNTTLATDSNLDNVTFNALTHFVEQTSKELKKNIKLLNEYKDVVDQSALISKTDVDGVITYVNDNFCKISQYSQDELLGKKHNIVRSKLTPNALFKKMWTTILSGKIWNGIISNKAKDGTIYHVDATIMPIYDDNNNLSEFIAIRQDITKQTESKKKIKEKEKFIKAIFENQDSIVVYTSIQDGMISVNKKLFDYFNYIDYADFKSQHVCICDLFINEDGYIHPEKDPNWIETIAHDRNSDYKAKMLIKDGTVHTFNVKIKEINDNYVINLNDITNLEKALFKAYQSEQAKSTFLANMSHEIRTPLNGIIGFTDILANKKLDKDAARFVQIIKKSGETLISVVNDILDFSKLENGELSLYETESNLFKEMEATVSTFASLAKNKNIEYFVFIDTDIPTLLTCDSQRLKQVINNLISNAIKFTSKHGKVIVKIKLIETSNSIAKIKFSVEDSGIGIPKNKIDKIFQAFSQADDSTSRKFGGTGLGLSISSQYIQMMHSKIRVKSVENRGSTFHFTLNLPIINGSYSIEKTQDKKSTNILVFDSTDAITCGINAIIYTYLESWNINYTKVSSLAELHQESNILIVCSKLFDVKQCKEALDKYEKLQLIYVEGNEEKFVCEHKKFHMIEQPMTGSLLFDKIISLTETSTLLLEEDNKTEQKQFKGKILIAEDNETNQILISIMLQERGLEFKIVDNGQKVLDEIEKNDSYDIILMDINMPVLDGIEATKLLRASHYTKPIVSLSANVIASDLESYIDAGVDDTLHKPIDIIELNRVLLKYLGANKIEENSPIHYDNINLESLGKALGINNQNVLLKLLKSFASSAEKIIQTLESNNLDADLLHTLKGLSGNMRFTILYDLVTKYENELHEWSPEEHSKNKEIVIQHLNNLVEKIALLHK